MYHSQCLIDIYTTIYCLHLQTTLIKYHLLANYTLLCHRKCLIITLRSVYKGLYFTMKLKKQISQLITRFKDFFKKGGDMNANERF